MESYMTYLNFISRSVLRIGFLACAIVFVTTSDIQATHIVGGDLTYQCLGGNMYRIRLTVRRDCFLGAEDAPFDNPASIGLFDPVTGQRITPVGFPQGQFLIAFDASDTLNEILVSDCSVVMGDVCVHTTVYDTVIALPYHANGYMLVYQRCCRNASLNNVENPLQTGMSLVAELSGPAQLECNSSPRFGDFPPIYTCVNKEIVFDHSAFDLEGDSLVYELCTPLTGGSFSQPKPQPPTLPPYDEIVFRPPYSLANIMGGVPLQIDPATGLITGTPNTIGQFVVGICVTAYDEDGNMTGRTRRDFQFNVRLCRDVPVADFSAPALDCEDLTVTFQNLSLLSDEFKWIFDFGNPLSDSTTDFEPTYTFPAEGFYDVALIVNDSMEFCFDTIVKTIGVFDSQIDAGFTYDVSSCSEDGIVLNVTDTSTGFHPDFPACEYEWLLTVSPGGLVLGSTQQNPTFPFDISEPSTAFLALVVTSCNGCTATQTTSFSVQEISLAFNPQSDSICFGESTNLLIGGDSTLDYTWTPETGLILDEEWDPIASPEMSIDYFVTVTDGLCEVTGSTHVEVQQLPQLAFDYETDCKSLFVQFDNNTTGGTNFFWDFGDTTITTDTSSEENPTFIYDEPGVYTVTLFSRDGCDVSVTREVTADAIAEDLDTALVNCFMEGIFLNPVHDTSYNYIWSGGLPAEPNPFAVVQDDTEFFVTISSPGLPGCEIVDSVTVLVPDDFVLDAGGNDTTCVLTDILLTATTDPVAESEFDFVWVNESDSIISMLTTVMVSPSETQTYYVTATDSLGCSMTDSVSVIRQQPGFGISPLADTAYCNVQTISLVTSTTVPDVSFQWFNVNDELIGEGVSVDVTPGTVACYYVIATELVSQCQVSDTACLTPTFTSFSISDDQTICVEDSIELFLTDNLGHDSLTYIWSPIEFLTGGVTSSPLVDPPSTQEFCVTVTIHDNNVGCKDTLCTTVVVSQFEPIDVIVDADPDTVILTEPVQLTVNQPCHYTFEWSSNPALPDPIPSICDPLVYPTEPTTFTVTVTNEDGCTAVASVSVGVNDPFCDERDIFLPNAFTPNGDGHNDVLMVRSNFISSFEIHIYNRWGEEVFSSYDANNGWNGTFRGTELAPDVFGYYMTIGCPNEKSYSEKGNITLLR